jgi:hypothetical protein
MTRTVKIAIVLLCFALCAAGALMAPSAREQSEPPQKVNAIPVKNHEIARRVWIMAARL